MTIAIVNGSECYCSAAFYDINNAPFIPTSIEYRVDDITDDLNIVPWTAVPLAQSVIIAITADQNTMQTANTTTEQRQVLVKIGIPGGTTRTDVTTYTLINEFGTP